ncbi:MAG: hypothetical protein ACRDK0_06895, partial [Solirubrobacteraceae bacterium]
ACGRGGAGRHGARDQRGRRSAAQQPPPPIASELFSGRAVFTDDIDLKLKIKLDRHATRVVKAKDPSRTLVARFTVQPGAQFPWHSHAGP